MMDGAWYLRGGRGGGSFLPSLPFSSKGEAGEAEAPAPRSLFERGARGGGEALSLREGEFFSLEKSSLS